MQVFHGRHIKYLFICNIFSLCTLCFCLGLGEFISISISLEGNKTDHPWSELTQRDHFHLPLLFCAASEGCVYVCLCVCVHCPLCPALSTPLEAVFLSSRVLSLFWCLSHFPHSWGPPAQPAWWGLPSLTSTAVPVGLPKELPGGKLFPRPLGCTDIHSSCNSQPKPHRPISLSMMHCLSPSLCLLQCLV